MPKSIIYKRTKPKKNWMLQEVFSTENFQTIPANYCQSKYSLIIQNDRRQNATSIGVVGSCITNKVKHFKCWVQVPILEPGMLFKAAIMYYPESVVPNTQQTANASLADILPSVIHPEWVLAQGTACPNEGGGNLVMKISSGRLERKLQAGDQIFLVCSVINASATATGFLRYTFDCLYAVSAN